MNRSRSHGRSPSNADADPKPSVTAKFKFWEKTRKDKSKSNPQTPDPSQVQPNPFDASVRRDSSSSNSATGKEGTLVVKVTDDSALSLAASADPPKTPGGNSVGNLLGGQDKMFQDPDWQIGYDIALKRFANDEKSEVQKSLKQIAQGKESIQEVIQSAKEAKESVDRDRSTMKIRFNEVIDTFNKYANIVDVMINHQPEYTALVWGSIRLMFQVFLSRLDECR